MNVSTPPSTGFTNRWDNATILNRGVEFSIKSRNLIGEFQWTTELNFGRTTTSSRTSATTRRTPTATTNVSSRAAKSAAST